MNLEKSEGYLEALKDVKVIIENKINEIEYFLGESYSEMNRRNKND